LRTLVLFFLLLIYSTISVAALTIEELRFCYERELWEIPESVIREQIEQSPQEIILYDMMEDIALARQDSTVIVENLELKVLNLKELEDAFRLFTIYSENETDELSIESKKDQIEQIRTFFKLPSERLILEHALGEIDEETLFSEMRDFSHYPVLFDNYIQRFIDEIAVEHNDSLRVSLSEDFLLKFPNSSWQDTNIYYRLISYLNLEEYERIVDEIDSFPEISAPLAVLLAGLLTDPGFRSSFDDQESSNLLFRAAELVTESYFPDDKDFVSILYQKWDRKYWEQKRDLQLAKVYYYLTISAKGFWGDEDRIARIIEQPDEYFYRGFALLKSRDVTNNDFGEIAGQNYWLGRFAILLDNDTDPLKTAEYFIDCLIAGAPRKRFDASALSYLELLHQEVRTDDNIMDWSRRIKNYKGPVFTDITEEAGFDGLRFRRIAIGDYTNDTLPDLLFNGHRLYRNEGAMSFTELTEDTGIVNYSFTGGLWADFDKDGLLDFAALSSSIEGPGNTLFRNLDDGRFLPLDSEGADINDFAPTEGAAWIDFENTGYPSLYTASYELWQVQHGFQDHFWYNNRGVFYDKITELGFLSPAYTREPGMAGRGVSPADHNNDGRQSIFVSNYRLNRNFFWEYEEGMFHDRAALNRLAGNRYRSGGDYDYYGHTIGAAWGDFNNNGRLDLFIANLAHPRFIEFSDISMLLRNDGLSERTIGDTTIVYHKFTDVTEEAGITFDELHSDPNWFDADNDGFLDIYITSVYENDRSYLYLNNRDGTFTDITWLSGTRTYNGWGNAVADLNCNGKLDLIVGSGNGVKIFRNDTENDFRSLFIKPYWDGEEVKISTREEWQESMPNSPAFGSKVEVEILLPDGSRRTLIRELFGGRGTTSQNDQFLHFGLGEGELQGYRLFQPE